MAMQWEPRFGDVGQYAHTITLGSRGGNQQEAVGDHYAAGGYGYAYSAAHSPAYPPRKPPWYGGGGGGGGYYPPHPQPTAWDGRASGEYPPQNPPAKGGYAPQPAAAAGWEEYRRREPPAYGGHSPPAPPPRRPVDWDNGAHEYRYPPSQQQQVNKKPESKPPGPGQEPPPNANKEVEDMPKASPKHEGKPPSAVYPPRKHPPYGYGHPHPGWGSDEDYYGGGGYYPPTQGRGYPPPSLPPPYQGGHGGGYDMGWPVLAAPPTGTHAAYGAYHKHHGGYGYGGGRGYGGGGYGNGKYRLGQQGKFKHYAHHHGKF